MDPSLERQVKRWMEKAPCPKEEMFPSWLLSCKCISCRKERARIGIERKEDEQTKSKTLSEEHRIKIRVAMRKSWDRKKSKEKIK